MMDGCLKQLAALIMPLTIAGAIPALLITTNSVNPAWTHPFPFNLILLVVGLGLIFSGLILFLLSLRLLIGTGKGTLAPWDPTQRLVVRGIYRYVRNPMISGVGAILFGEVALFVSLPLLLWTLGFTVLNMVYIPYVEERDMRERFGSDYDEYTRNVPRWIPRLKPWRI